MSVRNAAAKSLSAVATRTASQSTCSRTARTAGSIAAKSQWCSLSDRSFSVTTTVGGRTGIRIARTSSTVADSRVAASTDAPLSW